MTKENGLNMNKYSHRHNKHPPEQHSSFKLNAGKEKALPRSLQLQDQSLQTLFLADHFKKIESMYVKCGTQ